jgi:hypothetical protein
MWRRKILYVVYIWCFIGQVALCQICCHLKYTYTFMRCIFTYCARNMRCVHEIHEVDKYCISCVPSNVCMCVCVNCRPNILPLLPGHVLYFDPKISIRAAF